MEELLISLGFVEDDSAYAITNKKLYGNIRFVLSPSEQTSAPIYIYVSYSINYPVNKIVNITKIQDGSYGVSEDTMQFKIDSLETLSIILKSII